MPLTTIAKFDILCIAKKIALKIIF